MSNLAEKYLNQMESQENHLFPSTFEERRDWILERLSDESGNGYYYYNFQSDWLKDTSKFKVANKARQVGWSHILSLESLIESFLTGNDGVVISASLDVADELMDKILDHLEALKQLFPNIKVKEARKNLRFNYMTESGEISDRYVKIRVMASNPRTARSMSANVYLDEFAFHESAEDVYRAIFPSLSRSKKSLKMRIVSTPAGKQGKFYDLFSNPDNDFKKYEVYIDEAIKAGVDLDKEELRRNMNEDDFLQEFCGVFLDANYSYFPLELIHSCVMDGDYFEQFKDTPGEYFMGIDVGRVNDPTVIYIGKKIKKKTEDRIITYFQFVDMVVLKDTEFEEQESTICILIEKYDALTAIDKNGLGMQMAERLKKKYGSKVIEFTFTNESKGELVNPLKIGMQSKQVLLPSRRDLITATHSIKSIRLQSGKVKYEGSTKNGHADEFWALALSYYASHYHKFIDFNVITGKAKRAFTRIKRFAGGLGGY